MPRCNLVIEGDGGFEFGGVNGAGFDGFAGVAAADGPGGDVFEGDSVGSDDGAFVDGDAGADEGTGGDPGLGFDGDGGVGKGEVGVFVVVGAGAEVGVLADDGVIVKGNGGVVVDIHVASDPGVGAHLEVPGHEDADAGADDAAGADAGAEEAEEGFAEESEGARGALDDVHEDELPDRAPDEHGL